jgi:hypothetical protein
MISDVGYPGTEEPRVWTPGATSKRIGSPFGAPSPEVPATTGEFTRLKIPVSGVQFSCVHHFFRPPSADIPRWAWAIRHLRVHEPRGMPCDPLGPFLIADWVPDFGGDPPRAYEGRRPNRSPTTSVERKIFCSNRPPPHGRLGSAPQPPGPTPFRLE